MCTGIQVTSIEGNTYWGRTQEFGFPMPMDGITIPRGYEVKGLLLSDVTFKYASMGCTLSGKDYNIDNVVMLMDGINENGLVGGTFYFGSGYHNYATQEEVEAVTRLTAIHDDIEAFTEGYDTVVGERGVSLSGGQKQRISIARALLMNPELLILDDALSAVDAKTEEAIVSALKETRSDKTTIICAHRLSSVQHSEQILVLENGELAQSGRHAELMLSDGWYSQIFEQQQLVQASEGGEG